MGAAFVVFNGALKASLLLNAKQSIIEDGVMIQIEIETMNKLKQEMKSMKPFRIECLKSAQTDPNNQQENNIITIEWTKEDHYLNRSRVSEIDGRPMQGVKSLRLTSSYDFANETKSVRWTEIFLIKIEDDANADAEEMSNFNLNRFADAVSQAACTALVPVLDDLVALNLVHLMNENQKKRERDGVKQNFNQVCANLKEGQVDAAISEAASDEPVAASSSQAKLTKSNIKLLNPFRVSLRVELSKDQVGYIFGMNGEQISDQKVLTSLDNELIQMLNQIKTLSVNILVEFVFSIQERSVVAKNK
jgi:hypothetical protein